MGTYSGKRCVESIVFIPSYNSNRLCYPCQLQVPEGRSYEATTRESCLEDKLSIRRVGREVEGGESAEMGAPKLHSHGSHGPSIPNDQLPVNSGRTDLGDRPTLPFVRSNARDGVLMYGEQLRLSLRTSTASTGARDTPGIRVPKGVKGRAVQFSGSTRTESGRTERGFWSGRIVETSDEPPSTFVSGEDIRLAIVASSNDRVFGGPDEGDERESGHSDGTNCGTRARVDDADGAIVTFGSVLNIIYAEKTKWACLRMREHLQMERKKRCAPNPQQGWRIHRKRCRMEAFHPRTWGRV